MLSVLVKRETGENPVRTRHCDKGVSANKPLVKIGKAAANDDLSARRPALCEGTAATRNWTGEGKDKGTDLYVSYCLHANFVAWRFF